MIQTVLRKYRDIYYTYLRIYVAFITDPELYKIQRNMGCVRHADVDGRCTWFNLYVIKCESN